MSPTREEQWKRWQKLRYLAPLRRRFVFCSRKVPKTFLRFETLMLSLTVCYFIATLREWSNILPNFITQSELKPVEVRFTHFPRLAPAPRQWSLLALSCIATLSDWLEDLAALYQPIRRVKLKRVVARFTHVSALGTRSTPVILDFVVLHCYTFWLLKKISRHSINQSEDYNLNQSWLG